MPRSTACSSKKTPLKSWLESRWYSDRPPPLWLLPLAWLYGLITKFRRARLTRQAQRLPVPVIVVGNISVGGTGKTPLVIWLVEQLRDWGYTPGVISRGYGGHSPAYPLEVEAQTDAAVSGDEPLLMARRLRCPLVVAPDRLAAARFLLQRHKVDVLVADDGLQHYRLPRDLEICVVDGQRGLGNGALLPAGPLRESSARLREVGLVVVNGGQWRGEAQTHADMRLRIVNAVSFNGEQRVLESFKGESVHAVAGIGHPERFFAQLRAFGLEVIAHPFPDHHRFSTADLDFADELPVLMTEKDAVKCAAFAQSRHWFVPVTASLHADDTAHVRKLCERLRR
jgi:tetraacyldisaccharide 4'-kinase